MKPARRSTHAGARQDPGGAPVHGSALGRDPEALRPEELEPLVIAVCALDGQQAAFLLEGLADPSRLRALVFLGRWLRWRRGQRHATLEWAFGARGDVSGSAGKVPGALGENLRRLLAGGSPVPSRPGPIERWARRLVVEHGSRD
jgi:hypothetical protein